MTAPVPPPMPMDWTNRPTWCASCEIHQTTASRPICPICLDDDRRAKESKP